MAVAQEQTVTLDLKQVTLDELFGEIRRQTGIRFLCNAEQVKAFGLVDVSAEAKTVKDVLTDIFQGSRFDYSFERDVVTVMLRKSRDDEKTSVTVKGFVYDEKKQPLPGVTVRVVGTSVGTATTERGWFSIDLPLLKGQLEFSFVGYKIYNFVIN